MTFLPGDLPNPESNIIIHKCLRDHLSLVMEDHLPDFFKLFPFDDELKGFAWGQYPQT